MRDDTVDFLLAAESLLIENDVAALMDDTQLSVAITYQAYAGVTHTVTTGAYTSTPTSSSIRAIRNVLESREVRASNGLYQLGDIRFMIARTDFTGTPTREDRIVQGSDTYELIDWETDPLSALWNIVARGVR